MPTVRRMKAKMTLLGEGGVGKTSLIRRFVLNEYRDTYLHTIGTKVSKIELAVPYGSDLEVQMDLSIFDIMGQRGFKDLVRETYYHGSQALMAVCDITRRDSLDALNEWIPPALEIAGEVPVYLVVNKMDMLSRRAVTDQEIRRIAELFEAPVLMTSARTGASVEDAFNSLAIDIVDRAFRQERAQTEDRSLREKVLLILSKRGNMGLTRSQFFDILHGLDSGELQANLERLREEGLIELSGQGPTDFTAVITSRGVEEARRASAGWEE